MGRPDYPSLPVTTTQASLDVTNNLILQEMSYDKVALHQQAISLTSSLNPERRTTFDKVMSSLNKTATSFFFVQGYGGTRKTFLWNALTSTLHARGDIVLTVASSGIVATLLPSGWSSNYAVAKYRPILRVMQWYEATHIKAWKECY
ncbi:hypothetical protein K1719_032361 [Acacia pycnantha]|nr:hypothetical protein K1719_032361 [Acacia pycnantha]